MCYQTLRHISSYIVARDAIRESSSLCVETKLQMHSVSKTRCVHTSRMRFCASSNLRGSQAQRGVYSEAHLSERAHTHESTHADTHSWLPPLPPPKSPGRESGDGPGARPFLTPATPSLPTCKSVMKPPGHAPIPHTCHPLLTHLEKCQETVQARACGAASKVLPAPI